MNHTLLSQYVRQWAERLIELQHTKEDPRFLSLSMEEVISQASVHLDMARPFVVKEEAAFQAEGADIDQPRKRQELSLLFLQHVPIGDHAQKATAYDTTERLGWKLAAKMLHDKYQYLPEMRGFEPLETEGEQVGPFFDNCFGVRFVYSFHTDLTAQFHHDPTDYLP